MSDRLPTSGPGDRGMDARDVRPPEPSRLGGELDQEIGGFESERLEAGPKPIFEWELRRWAGGDGLEPVALAGVSADH